MRITGRTTIPGSRSFSKPQRALYQAAYFLIFLKEGFRSFKDSSLIMIPGCEFLLLCQAGQLICPDLLRCALKGMDPDLVILPVMLVEEILYSREIALLSLNKIR